MEGAAGAAGATARRFVFIFRPTLFPTPHQIAWGHPDHGSVLAVAATDGGLTMWHEACGPPPRAWTRAARFTHGGAPTALAFAPAVAGPRLAAACADGAVRVYVATSLLAGPGSGWELESVVEAGAPFPGAPPAPAGCVVWRPHDAGAVRGDLPALLAVGGGQGASLHCYRVATAEWTRTAHLPAALPAAAVAWAPAPSPSARDTVAVAAGADVALWRVSGGADALTAETIATLPHSAPVWRLEWQPLSGALVAGTRDGRVVVWREDLAGEWRPVGAVVAEGAVAADATAVAV